MAVFNFWNEDVWFPEGISWDTMSELHSQGDHPGFSDMYYAVGIGIILLLIRILLEICIARPCFALLNARGRFKSVRDRKSKTNKFCECFWRCTFYTVAFIYGLRILWNKKWLWNTVFCWIDYPYQPVSFEIQCYYLMEAGFYWSLALSQFKDARRKDFWMLFVHHFATIVLIWLSWSLNFVRIGSLVLVVHDAGDIWLEAAKMARYCNRNGVAKGIFAVFLVVWFVTRLGVFPFWILNSTFTEYPAIVGLYPAFYVFNGLLSLLLVLHLVWTWMILKTAFRALTETEPDDYRSEDENEVSENEENDQETKLLSSKTYQNGYINNHNNHHNHVNNNHNNNNNVLYKQKRF